MAPMAEESDLSSLIPKWRQIQNELREKLIAAPLNPLPRFVAGVDAAFSKDMKTVLAAAVVYDRIDRRIVEVRHADRPAEYPYIPGFLSFREGPAVLAAIRSLRHEFGVVCFDGQGIAHPRRCGIAAHMSVILDVPGVGVAKSRLFGTYEEPGESAGSSSPLMDGKQQIGVVLRTRDGVRPLFISVGQRMNLASAVELVLACSGGKRLPEPTRQADIEVAKLKRSLNPSDELLF